MAAITLDTPLAEALSTAIHTRIVEEGWTQEDDTALAEYIVLMLANGKTQDQVASELAGELLQDAQGTEEFARWLFDKVTSLSGGSAPAEVIETSTAGALEQSDEPTAEVESSIPAAYDTDMGDSAPDNAPRGPRGMSGRGSRGGRPGSIAKPDSALHRVRGNDRVNSHVRGAPKGPRNTQNQPVRPGMQKAINGLMGAPPGPQNPMMQNGGMQAGQQMWTPEQQMQYMQMMEQQAQLMAQMMNQQFNGQQPHQNGNRSLFDRVERGRGGARGGRGRGTPHQNGTPRSSVAGDAEAKESDAAPEGEQPSHAPASSDPFTVMCKFNTRCTNANCSFVHQSPAAPMNTPVDMSQTCSFGVTCKNFTCVARHPSPAQKGAHQAQEQCRFWPNCTKPGCPFKHPQAPLCQYGASCNTENCKYTHLETPCHFNPCTNARCPYKHAPGQNRNFDSYTWTPEMAKKKQEQAEQDHVSDRRFVDEKAGPEELIKAEPNGDAPVVVYVPAEEANATQDMEEVS